jgi:hypothetical protein
MDPYGEYLLCLLCILLCILLREDVKREDSLRLGHVEAHAEISPIQ